MFTKLLVKVVLLLFALISGVVAYGFGERNDYNGVSIHHVGATGGAIAFGIISAACIIAFALVQINDTIKK